MPNFPKICAVVVTYNIGEKYLENFKATINQVDKIIIIDNGSGDETLKLLDKLAGRKKIEVIYNRRNEGLGKAQNQGIKLALAQKFDWILLLDHDSKPEAGMVKKMLVAYEFNPAKIQTGIISPYIKDTQNPEPYRAITQRNKLMIEKTPVKNKDFINGVLIVISSGSLIKAEVFEKVGMMREDFFIDYLDLEFCLRAITNGYNIMIAGKAELEHNIGKRSVHKLFGINFVTDNYPVARRRIAARNFVIFFKKYWQKVPSMALYTMIVYFYNIFLILMFEDDKWEKTKSMVSGLKDGIIKS